MDTQGEEPSGNGQLSLWVSGPGAVGAYRRVDAPCSLPTSAHAPAHRRCEGRRGWGAVPPQTPVADKCRLSAREITWRLVIGEYSRARTDAADYCIGVGSRNLPVSQETTLT